MQAVLLCAGKSTRTYPLTAKKPKPLLKVLGKSILEHNLEQLYGLVDEIILVVGYKKEMIEEKIGKSFGKLKVKYVEQKEQTGTGSALLLCKHLLQNKFLVMNGDDFYSKKDIERCLKHDYCVLVNEVMDPRNFGIVELDGKKVIGFEEKPEEPKSNLANTGLYVFDKKIFNLELKKSERGEYEITDYLKYLIENNKIVAERVEDYWKPIVFSWSLFYIRSLFLNRLQMSEIWGQIDDEVVTNGHVIIEEGAQIKGKTVIEGNLYLGKGSILEDVHLIGNNSIGDNCKIFGSKIARSIIGDSCEIKDSILKDSIIGDSVNLESIETKNEKNGIKVKLNGRVIDCKRKKLGALIGDDISIKNIKLNPGESIKQN